MDRKTAVDHRSSAVILHTSRETRARLTAVGVSCRAAILKTVSRTSLGSRSEEDMGLSPSILKIQRGGENAGAEKVGEEVRGQGKKGKRGGASGGHAQGEPCVG